MPSNETPRFLKVSDAARCLGLTKSTVYDWIARGYLPCHRFGRTVRIDAQALAEFIERSKLNDLATAREIAAQGALLGTQLS